MASKLHDNLMTGSSEYHDNLHCEPCFSLKKQVNATGHCLDCVENLCKECTEYHTAMKVCVNHKLLCEPRKLFLCKPCSRLNTRNISSGFGLDCRESLCSSCYDYHPRPSATRDHRLVQKQHLSETVIVTMLSRVKKVPSVFLPTLTAENIDLCVPCLTKSNAVAALSHCKTCKENLCYDCFHYHRAIAVCMNHVLKEYINIPIGWCKPCARRSKRSLPQGCCLTCAENLCSGCYGYHKGPVASKTHSLNEICMPFGF